MISSDKFTGWLRGAIKPSAWGRRHHLRTRHSCEVTGNPRRSSRRPRRLPCPALATQTERSTGASTAGSFRAAPSSRRQSPTSRGRCPTRPTTGSPRLSPSPSSLRRRRWTRSPVPRPGPAESTQRGEHRLLPSLNWSACCRPPRDRPTSRTRSARRWHRVKHRELWRIPYK